MTRRTKAPQAVLVDPTDAQIDAVSNLNLRYEAFWPEGAEVDFPAYDRSDRLALVVGSPTIYADDEDRSNEDTFVDAVDVYRPDTFILETVRGLAGPRFAWFLEDLVDELTDLGYIVGYTTLTVEGSKRLFIVGRRDAVVTFQAGAKGIPAEETVARLIQANLVPEAVAV